MVNSDGLELSVMSVFAVNSSLLFNTLFSLYLSLDKFLGFTNY